MSRAIFDDLGLLREVKYTSPWTGRTIIALDGADRLEKFESLVLRHRDDLSGGSQYGCHPIAVAVGLNEKNPAPKGSEDLCTFMRQTGYALFTTGNLC